MRRIKARVRIGIKNWVRKIIDPMEPWIKNAWSYLGWDDLIAFILFVIGILGFIIKPLPFIPVLNDIIIGSRAELIGIGIGVFVIGNAGEARERIPRVSVY